MSEWQPIETAPKDGTRIAFKNEQSGLEDIGHWDSWTDMPNWRRELLPDFAKEWDGEWSTDFGNGDMTHWMPLPPPPATLNE
jgi:hypothetical protein